MNSSAVPKSVAPELAREILDAVAKGFDRQVDFTKQMMATSRTYVPFRILVARVVGTKFGSMARGA